MTPVVFVHGFLGGSQQWQGQIKALAEHDVLAVDLPGFGLNAHLEPLTSIPAYAAWVLEAATAHGLARFHLVGHSMGGMIAQDMAHQAPDKVQDLVLYGTGATGVLPGRFETIETSMARSESDGAQATARRIAATWFLHTTQANAYQTCVAIAEQARLAAILAGLDAMRMWDGVDRLGAIKARTLLIWGDRDRTYQWSQIQQLWTLIPGARLAVLPDCAHAAHLEKPHMFDALLRDFLSRG
ncbi:MAG: alpha/beta hydrolase [Pseudomonadota bacterium]